MLYRIPAKYQQISQQGRQGRLQELAEYAAGRMIILPGAGITYANAEQVADAVGVSEVHGTKIVKLG